jgi:long-chain-fatty-acid--[acyl-carrier-protein] ligase
MAVLRYVLWALLRFLLSLRYRLRVRGLEQVRGLTGPTLVLPNHPGYVDPPLVFAALWPTLRMRPMVYEGNFQNPVMRFLARVADAVPVPDLERASAEARARAGEAIEGIIEGLRRGENQVLWPAGRVQHNGSEVLGGARALADILRAVPEVNVVLVRTRGVWGSSFTHAPTGTRPDMRPTLLRALGWLAANLFFFMPRRQVDMTVEVVERSRLPEPRREMLNPWLEEWYNRGGAEKPTFVPYHFLFGARTFEFPGRADLAEADLRQVRPETKEAVNHFIADRLGRPLTAKEQRPETTFDQLGLDSLDRMEVALHVEQQFGFTADQVPANLGELWALAQGLAEKGPPKPPPPAWFRPPSDEGEVTIPGDTVAEAFVARALANPRDVAAADDLAGVLTYRRMLVGALAMARRFRALTGDNVGLMLPASVACDTAYVALHLAGKLPVLLNWTTGPANLRHAARLTGLSRVVTSKAFVDRTGITVEGAEYVFLEDLRAGMGKVELLRTLLSTTLFPGRVRARVPRTDPQSPAVVLFTSGSEKAPKAVPLTHSNILSNLKGGVPELGLTGKDSILGFLPAFHSFGLTVTCVMPVLGGMKVVHHPDPTDAGGLVRKIAGYRPTVICGTPTFVSYILERAKPGQLDSLRIMIVGAEKAPPALFERAKQLAPRAMVLEGYGITECSPVVAGNTPGKIRQGTVGKPLPPVEVCVVDLDTDRDLPAGEVGMLLVTGPTVFPGYLGTDAPSPFRERGGKRWYVTGDLVSLDRDGYIRFAGRLKRFLKAGGEMISLPALEEPFARMYPATEEGPRVAVEGVETEDGRRIVLFTTEDITLRDANMKLIKEGFRGVMRLDEARKVDAIPVLGTGKTDYKVLRSWLTEGGKPAPAAPGAAQ